MKRILFSIATIACLSYTSHAQTTVTQGSAPSSANHSNTVVLDQKIDVPGYTVNAHSSSSYLSVVQTQDASAVGNVTVVTQDGAYNYLHQIQNGSNNNTSIIQNNLVTGTSWDDGNRAYTYIAGQNNTLEASQTVNSSNVGQGGNRLFATQDGLWGTMKVTQVSDGRGHYVSATQGAASEYSTQVYSQYGSENSIQGTQVNGYSNLISVFQRNNDPEAIGSSFTGDQRGGNENRVIVHQEGSENSIASAQNGNNNEFSGVQEGTGNKLTLSSTGDLNHISFIQAGINHDAKITQSGVANISVVDQRGLNNTLTINQSKNQNVVISIQLGEGNTSTINQTGGYGTAGLAL